MEDLTFELWLEVGVRQGWATAPVCYTHDGLPMTSEEEQELYEGDPCIHIIRLCETPEEQAAIEADHTPSQWRRSNRGL
jgi:hypothetical protein